MVNVMKGVLVECDPAMKQFLLHLDDTNALGKKFVLQDLDDTHMFISADIVEILQDKIDDLMDRLSFPLAENLMETQTSVWQWRPQKRPRDIRDQFFEDGDRFCCYSVKQLPQETDTEDCRRISLFPCSIAACPETFDTLLGYENHYNSVHRHTCSECRRSYPSNHLLEVHLREAHDPLFSLQSGDKFVCLVQGCDQKFTTPKIRKNHMVKKHKYPANYRFDRAKPGKAALSKAGGDTGSDLQSQTGVNSNSDRQSQAIGDTGTGDQNVAGQDMEVTMVEKENIPQEGGAKRVFSYKVPQNICFGHGSTRSFQRPRGRRKAKHWHQSTIEMDTSVHIENVDMGELKDALE